MMEQTHPGEARFGDLRGTDRIIDGRGFAEACGIVMRFTAAEVEEVGLGPVARTEIEMRAAPRFEEGGCKPRKKA